MFKKKSPVKKKFQTVAKAKKHRRQLDPRTRVIIRQVLIGVSILVAILVLMTAIWYGTRVSFLTITTVTVEGGETIKHEQVVSTAQAVLEGQYVGLIPRRFTWSYPAEEITERISEIPRLKDPVIKRVSGTELHIQFAEYIPHALWCQGRGSEECYFIDETGYAFSKAPKLEGGAFPRFHTIGTKAAERTVMIPIDDLRAIEALREAISINLGLPIAYVETDMVRDVFLGVAGGGEIKATLRMTPEETVSNLSSILAAEAFADIAPGSFQYIDLRFGNKVFVNEEPLRVATTTGTTTPTTTTGLTDTLTTINEANTSLISESSTE